MRTFAYVTAILTLAAGMLWAGSWGAFFLALSALVFFQDHRLVWLVYGVGMAVNFAWIGRHAVRALVAVWRNGPPVTFRGWRYVAAAACALVFFANVSMLAAVALTGRGEFLVVPNHVAFFYLPAVLLAMAALPSSR